MRILLDMNLSPAWLGFLEDAGFEAVHWSTVGNPAATDREIMSWALDNAYVMPSAIGNDVVRVLRMREDAIEAGAIVSIDARRSRVRILPIETAPSEGDEPA